MPSWVDGLRDRLDTLAYGRVQHLAAAEVRDERIAPLAESDQGPPLLCHPAHAEPCLAPVPPVPGGEWRQPALRRDLADPPQHVIQYPLLHPDLGHRVLMLQAAATADAEVVAARRDPLGRRAQHLDHGPLIEAALCPGIAETHPFPGKRTVEEHHLAVEMGQAPALMGQGFDLRLDRLQRQWLALLGQLGVYVS